MNAEEYKAKIKRLHEIETLVKDPEFSLDNIDAVLEETAKLAEECKGYTRELLTKVDSL